jgi:hypothetical protein
MRIPEPTDRPSSARHPPGGPPADPPGPNGPSSVVPLRASADDAPTVITTPRPAAPADPGLGLAPGERLGHFELIGAVGSGGMAAVLKARDLELGRLVALKILPPHMARDPENVTRFKAEARAAARLDHDNIARVFFCGEDRGLHFIAFEFVEGDNLRSVIERRGPLPPAECVRYMLQAAAGLAHAAERGVVHRDVKPSNIIVTPDGKAKIVDMGLARNLAASVNGGVTQSGVTLGTFDYISPEQALDPRRADVRSDIYSLGCAFYHALTGRPPVPEGTAAKKLFAHRHEPILDPRVLNPQVPDELAAVLSRMMAKDPAKRFQTPAELIAALTALARRMNLGTDTMPALDPALLPADPSAVQLLPQPPRLPVGLVIGVAALAVATVVLLGLSGPGGGGEVRPSWEVATAPTRVTPPAEPTPNGQNPTPPAVPAPGPSPVAAGVEDLARHLADPAVAEVRLEPGKVYDLTALPDGVVIRDRKQIAVVGLRGPVPPVVRVAAYPAVASRLAVPPRGTLTIHGVGSVRFQGVRFDVADGPVSDETADRPVGVLIAEAARLSLSECRFQADPGLRSTETAGLAVHRGPEGPSTEVEADSCYFGLRRGVAVQLAGRVRARVAESAFAPHPVAFALRGDPDAVPPGPGEPSELNLRHCSFLLDGGAIAEAEDGRWLVTAGYCVFAAGPPDPAAVFLADPPARPAVLRLPGDPAAARFVGRPGEPNAYYQTDPLADADRGYSFDEAGRWATPLPPAADTAAVELPQSPWESADPAAELSRRPGPGEREEPWKAFRLKTTLPQLRHRDQVLLGARSLPRADDRLYSPWPPPPIDAAVNTRVKVWWPAPPPGQRGNLPPQHFETLREAVAALRPDDELHIRHDGELVVPEARFEVPGLRATVKPYPGTRPVLVPEASDRLDAGLFRLVEGELTLEGLDIRLRGRAARPGDVRSRSAVTVVAGRRCVLRNCVITTEERDDEKMAVVVLADPDGEMRVEAERRPEVRLENCLVRGRGRAVWVQSARPFDLDLTNTMTALAGPVLAVDPPAKAPPANATARVRLTRLTAALAGPLLDLRPARPRAGRAGGWVAVEVETDRCLFAPVERGHPLVVIDGGDPAAPDRTFTWVTAFAGPNWYANFPAGATLLEIDPADEAFDPKAVGVAGWFDFTGEWADRSSGAVTFERPPESSRRLAAVHPADLAVRNVEVPGAMAGEAGADVKQLPTPADGPAP